MDNIYRRDYPSGTRFLIRKTGTFNQWEEVPFTEWFDLRTSVHYDTKYEVAGAENEQNNTHGRYT